MGQVYHEQALQFCRLLVVLLPACCGVGITRVGTSGSHLTEWHRLTEGDVVEWEVYSVGATAQRGG